MEIKSFLKSATLEKLKEVQALVSQEMESRRADTGTLDHVITYSDGASRGNPGLAGAGVLIQNARKEKVRDDCLFLGQCTNNEAEYRALLLALEHARDLTRGRVECYLDSELLVRQLNGRYAVKSEALRPFFNRVNDMRAEFDLVTFTHVPREHPNLKIVDRLANKAIDTRKK